MAVNGVSCDPARREANPYRPGGIAVPRAELNTLLHTSGNTIEIDL